MEGILRREKDLFTHDLVEQMVDQNHPYRKILKLVDFEKLMKLLSKNLYSDVGRTSLPLVQGFKTLILQYWEDFSDRQMERFLRENVAARYFCGFTLHCITPDHSYFTRLRQRIGTEKLSELFNVVVKRLKDRGYVGNVFHFVDSSKIISKVNLWEAYDRANAAKEKETSEKDDSGDDGPSKSSSVGKYSSDPDAGFGCKGKNKYWYGYKRHVRVDMKNGLITKSEVTPANRSDLRSALEKELLPDSGMVFMDKGYDAASLEREAKKRGCQVATIRKNNHKHKNFDLDRWRSKVRMPFEATFSKLNSVARFRGIKKIEFQNLMESMVFNFKKLINIDAQSVLI